MALTLMALLDPPLPSGRWQPMWVRVGNIWLPRADRVVQGEEYDRIHFATMSLSASILCLHLSASMPLFCPSSLYSCWLNVRIYDRGESGRV